MKKGLSRNQVKEHVKQSKHTMFIEMAQNKSSRITAKTH